MREADLLESNYTDDLRAEVMTLLAMVSAKGITEIRTQNLLNDLEEQGYAVDADSLMSLLDDMNIVSNASEESIKLSTSDADPMVGMDTDKIEADRVNALATNQAKKGIGESANGMSPGDPIIVVAPGSKYEGETGEIESIDDMYVVVNLYNRGKVKLNRDDVEFNDYADSDEEDADLRNIYGDDYNITDRFDEETALHRMRILAGLDRK